MASFLSRSASDSPVSLDPQRWRIVREFSAARTVVRAGGASVFLRAGSRFRPSADGERSHRVAVVDHDGTLVGVIGVTDDLAAFCGTG
jgi:CBS-domain-containing membrane protein